MSNVIEAQNLFNQTDAMHLLVQLLGGFTVTATGLCWGHEKTIGELSGNKQFEADLLAAKNDALAGVIPDTPQGRIEGALRFILLHFDKTADGGLLWNSGHQSLAEMHGREFEFYLYAGIHPPEKAEALLLVHGVA